MGRVLVVGSYNQDLVWEVPALPAPGETRAGTAFRSGPGGKGFNQAVAAARLGAETTFIAAVGEDALAGTAAALARAEGIEARWQRVSGQATGSAGLFVDGAGRNSIVVALGANAHLSVAHVEAQAEAFSGAAVVLAPLESPLPAIRAAMRLGRAAGAHTVLNPAPVPADLAAEALADVELLTPNETEFGLLLRQLADTTVDPAQLRELPNEALAALCARLPVPGVLVTLGEAGAFHAPGALGHGPATRAPAAAVKAIDTTGAGDAFNGALAAAWAEAPSAPVATLLPFASAAAGLSTEAAGAALAMPRRAELRHRFGW